MKRSTEKITSREELVSVLQNLHSMKGRSGYTSGVFDIVHAGHVDYLEKARAECDLLVVGINSDVSVRENKGSLRPINGESERAAVIAGLACVDHVFIFSERNNNKNVELLQPSIYFKAGDYSKESLSSAAMVESYGGKVRLIPFLKGYGTTSTINRIVERFSPAGDEGSLLEMQGKKPAVFLDRDGTLNEPVEYLHEPHKFKMIAGAAEALKLFQDKGYYLIIVTNQPGIGLGYFSKEEFFSVNKVLLKAVSEAGASIDKIYFCPHSKADNCSCRKPQTGMIRRAVKELNIDLEKSFVIGDSTADLMLAKKSGIKSVLVQTGNGGKDGLFDAAPDLVADDLLKAAELIFNSHS
ncbi:MAG: HAD-IIIA family hydrolase [Deltaproteobacteria bacterium]|nr:HAD-IIIA family hydrolase [Deltaproteobacteria bacterium]